MAFDVGKYAEKLKKANRFLADHKGDLEQISEAAKKIYDAVAKLAKEKKKDIGSVLTGNPVADAALIEAAGVETEIGSKIELKDVLELVYILVDLGGTFLGLNLKGK